MRKHRALSATFHFYIQHIKRFPTNWEIEYGFETNTRDEAQQISPMEYEGEVIGNIHENPEFLEAS
ncbi:hypothetical protein C7R93_18415 [Brevibacillus fortis]|uniref:YopX protein domain-containing protein n=1 Tax=Brevibacillus fortis TaxID=2126352 RepID=A0A2P7V2T2_9BACL|nr:hypothetical protein C7R93_18415 [Brevibacillus fortis]